MTDQQWYSRYSRHFLLNNFDETHQHQLARATITIVGMGGLGSMAAQQLAAMGVGTLNLVDHDTVSLSNLPRQFIYTQRQIGQPKVYAAQQKLAQNNSACTINPFEQRAAPDNLAKVCDTANALLDCTDTVTTRLQLSAYARQVNKALFSGSAAGFSGQVIAFSPHPEAPCYGCLSALNAYEPQTCLANGIFGPVVSTIALYQVMLLVYFITGIAPVPWSTLHCFDATKFNWRAFTLTPNPQCRLCQ